MHLDKNLGMTAANGQYTISGKVHVGNLDPNNQSGHSPSLTIKSGVGIGHMGSGSGGIGGVYLAGSGSGHDDLTGHGLSEVEHHQTSSDHQGVTDSSIGQVAGKDMYFKQNVTIQGGNRVYDTYIGADQGNMGHVGHTVIQGGDNSHESMGQYGQLQGQVRIDGTVPGSSYLIGPITSAPLHGGDGSNAGGGGGGGNGGGGDGGGGDGGPFGGWGYEEMYDPELGYYEEIVPPAYYAWRR